MKKYLSKGLGFLVLGSLFLGATPALAVTDTVTAPADNITTTSARLNGVNGDTLADSGQQAFWYGTTSSSPFVFTPDTEPTVVNQLPSGWVGGTFADTFGLNPGDTFSYSLSGLTPGTPYYYVAWSRVGGTWYPGQEATFMTNAPVVLDTTAPAIPTHVSPVDDVTLTTATANLIDWSDETDPSSPVVYYYEVSNSNAVTGGDDAFVTPIYTSSALNDSEIPTPGTPDGIYYWHVRAEDNARNSSNWSAPWKITVDNTCTTDFDLSTLGSVNGKEGWSVTGAYDQAIVANTYGFTSFGCKTLRISNSVTSGAFGDQTFSPASANEAGENATDNHFEAEFDIASTSSAQQAGLMLSVSPDKGDGSRMSFLRFEDQADGIHVIFSDVTNVGPLPTASVFNLIDIATIDRTPHTIKFVMDLIDGPGNDIVKIYIDGNLEHTGTSWENYYRFDPEQTGNGNVVPAVDSLIFRASGTAVPGNANNGFIFDNFNASSDEKNPTPTTDASITTGPNSATLHGTNGEIDSDAGNSQGFWYGPVAPLSPIVAGVNPLFPPAPGWVGGLFGTIDRDAGGDFEYSITGLAPSTTYYYVAWTQVGGIWYPGDVEEFETDANPQTINGSVSDKTYGDADFDLNTVLSASSGLPITYTQTSPLVCTISGSTLHIVSAGTCTFDADQAGNGVYDPAPTENVSFDVDPKTLTVTGIAAVSRTYDGTTSATFTGTPTLVGVVSGDVVTISGGTATFNNRHTGTLKPVTVIGMTLGGTHAGNYTLTQPTLSADITPRPITVTAVTYTKVYDGNTNVPVMPLMVPHRATITSGSLISGDSSPFPLGWAETYDTKDVGVSKTITPTPAPVNDGNSGANYAITYSTATGSITPKNLNVTPFGVNKVYDNTTTANLTFTDNRIGGDDLTLSGTANFVNELVGNGKVVNVLSVVKTGPDAGNYNINLTSALTLADITPATLVPVVTASDKVYDTTNTASATCAVIPLIGDSVTCSVASATFASANAGSHTVTATGMTLGGPDAGNYVLSSATGTDTATISQAPVTVDFTADNKVYDGNNSATINGTTVSGAILPDVVTTTGGSATFDNKNVGTGKTVTATGFGLNDSNYYIQTTNTTTADITVRTLNVTATGNNKPYDSTTAATVNFFDDRVALDVLTVSGTATFDTKNVGTGKTVSVTGIALTGTDAGNYTANAATSTTADITPISLTIVAAAQNKVVDGNTTATVTLTNDAIFGDVVTQTYTTADFDDANVGVGKTVTVSGIAIAGLDAGNYDLTSTDALTIADINARQSTSGSRPTSGGGSSRNNSNQSANGQVLGALKFNFTLLMKQGSAGNEVMELQKFLNANNFGPLVADGKFGPLTRAAVVRFQLANGLVGDGVVGPMTRAVLNK